ncbi:MAG: nucleotidyl transferase AbiEii/AbiGii toxin family protein [Candidatus Thermoplasmatota archaeon]|nr:nucleotidyl transferase AbiEii/AbiGii toxin family protein [Candidatus Thermoplasmatota archaeon]
MKTFFDQLNSIVKPQRSDIVEKDYHLHRLLYHISQDEFLKNNVVFKGGTCLVKAYLGYYRFSEDIDFTWKDTRIWKGKSNSQTRKTCSKLTDTIIQRFDLISNKLGLDFTSDKSDLSFVEMGSGGRMLRLFLRYHSEMLDVSSVIKIEINFVDKTMFPFKHISLQSLIETVENKETAFLFPEEWEEYKKHVSFDCYTPQEIFTDKARAAMTRFSYKFRDIIDICMLEQKYGFTISQYEKEIRKKTRFVLELYKRYVDNIKSVDMPDFETIPERERNLLLFKPKPDFFNKIKLVHDQLRDLQMDLVDSN